MCIWARGGLSSCFYTYICICLYVYIQLYIYQVCSYFYKASTTHNLCIIRSLHFACVSPPSPALLQLFFVLTSFSIFSFLLLSHFHFFILLVFLLVFFLFAQDTELIALCGDPICVSTLSSHCSGPCKCISIQHGVDVTS